MCRIGGLGNVAASLIAVFTPVTGRALPALEVRDAHEGGVARAFGAMLHLTAACVHTAETEPAVFAATFRGVEAAADLDVSPSA